MGNKSYKLKPEELASLREKTKFSEEELKLWRRVFSKNSVGHTLPCDAFMKIYGQYFPHGDASKFSKRVFARFDQDNSGSIDFNEFVTTLNVTSNGTLEQKLSWAFSLYDLDSNGFVSKEELTEIVTAIYEMIGTTKGSSVTIGSEKIVDRIFQEMDTNNDGLLSLAEFVEGGKSQAYLANILQVDDKPFQRSLLKRPEDN